MNRRKPVNTMTLVATLIVVVIIQNDKILAKSQEYLLCTREFCLPKDYEKLKLPSTKDNWPIEVETAFQIIQFTDVDEKNFWVEVITFMTLQWNEPRLIFTGNDKSKLNGTVPLNLDVSEKIWLPDLYVYDLKSVKFLRVFNEFGGIDIPLANRVSIC